MKLEQTQTKTQTRAYGARSWLLAGVLTGVACIGACNGCADWKSAGKVGTDISACLTPDVNALVPTVAAALNAPNWSAQMASLETLGVDVVMCAVQALLNQLGAVGAGTGAHGSFSTSQNTLLVTHAHAYLAAHGK